MCYMYGSIFSSKRSKCASESCFSVVQINSSPYEDGWLIKVKLSNKTDVEKLMDSEKYSEFQSSH